MRYVIGVDVGTGSARAGLFDETGHMLATASHAIPILHPQTEWAEQSSERIWDAVCRSVRDCVAACNVAPDQISGISYSATCSLVLLDASNAPLALSQQDGIDWNIIVWMDHRSIDEAAEATGSGASVLNNVGGTMSPEMEIPKLMWLKRHRPDLWSQMAYAGDLADFLTYRSSGSLQRSICTVGCKWTYDADNGCWDKAFLSQMGLDDLLGKAQLPEQAVAVGTLLGPLTKQAAQELGLTENCQVAAGLIDAHAGALGTVGLYADDQIERRMALIAGTSNCHIALNRQRVEIPGVWGPYNGAVVDGMWCAEGGQSATGALLDHVVALFGSDRFGPDPHSTLSKRLKERADKQGDVAGSVDVIPDFIGNRAPFADPELRGAITGLTIEDPEESCLKVYWAAASSIAYGTRLIIDQLNAHGYEIDRIHLSGGHKKSPLLVDLYADATGCDVVISDAEEPVLLGAAIAALLPLVDGCAIATVTAQMKGEISIQHPRPDHMALHEERYQRFLAHYRNKGLDVAAMGQKQ